jgi:hypothetical protein
LLKEGRYLTPVVFVGFIFIANYFFLNIMVAFSCENFSKISNEEFVNGKVSKKEFFENK